MSKRLVKRFFELAPCWDDADVDILHTWLRRKREPWHEEPCHAGADYGDLLRWLQDEVRRMFVAEYSMPKYWEVIVLSDDGDGAGSAHKSRLRCWMEVYCDLKEREAKEEGTE